MLAEERYGDENKRLPYTSSGLIDEIRRAVRDGRFRWRASMRQ